MAYNTNDSNKKLHPKTIYALYIGPNDSGTGHSVFNFSTKQLLTTPKRKYVPMSEDIIQAVNEMGTITNKIQLDHFDRDQHTVQQNHFGTTQDDNQEHYVIIENFDHESSSHLEDSQQIAGTNSGTKFLRTNENL